MNMMKESEKQCAYTHTEMIQWDSSWPALSKEEEKKQLVEYMEKRFGIPAYLFADYQFFCHRNSWHILKKSLYLSEGAKLKVSGYYGMKAFYKVGKYIKPTTRMIQLFGRSADRNIIFLTTEQACRLVNDCKVHIFEKIEDGYVIITIEERYIVGLGLVIGGVLTDQLSGSLKQLLKPTLIDHKI